MQDIFQLVSYEGGYGKWGRPTHRELNITNILIAIPMSMRLWTFNYVTSDYIFS